MHAVAPNLTALVGELIGARLIAHSGSLMNLAKSPGSTIQILGAEKALFRALKSKSDTPKYGLLYHASLVGQASGKNKGKVSRMLASKAALGLRVDALADMSVEEGGAGGIPEEERGAIGTAHRITIERRLAKLEGKPLRPKGVSIAPGGQSSTQPGKWEVKEARKYNSEADGISANASATKPTTNGVLNGETKMIEEMDGEEVRAEAGAADEDEDESMDEDDEDVEDRLKSASKSAAPSANGSKTESKAEKAKRKEEKRLRKAARQEKRDRKAAKKAAKEAKAAGKDAAPAEEESSKKKRKREEGEGEKSEKKKKKKSKE